MNLLNLKRYIHSRLVRFKYYLIFAYKYKTLSPRLQRNRSNTDRRKRRIKEVRANNPFCAKCKSTENLTIDHIVAKARGGSRHSKKNFQILCAKCNREKGSKIQYSV